MSAVAAGSRVQVLLIEDNPADADLIREYIEADGGAQGFDVSHVVRLEDALEQLRIRQFDVILTDFNLPDAAGMSLLEALRSSVPDTPIVVVTGASHDLDLALDALRHGAQDYLIKGTVTSSIHRSLRYAIERKQMQDALMRKEAELREINGELARQNAVLQAMLDNMADGVVIADRAGRFVAFNPAAERILGRGMTDTSPAQWTATYGVFHADGMTAVAESEMPLVRAIRGEQSNEVQLVVKRPDLPRTVYIQSTGQPLRDANGQLYGGMVVFHDITAHREAEEALKQKNDELTVAYAELDASRRQQLDLKDQVLSHVSHELRTPLTAANQFVMILKRGLAGELQPQQLEYVDDVERNLTQLRKMIGDLLETTRAESGKLTIDLQRLAVHDIATDVVRTLETTAALKGITLTSDVMPALPAVAADPARIRQVLTNLVDNALKFTPVGGSITIRAGVSDGNFVRVSVSDTGRGIDPAEHERIFSRLGQIEDSSLESRKGLGLGLFICREIVRRHGGEIVVESTLGAGATFSFTLPIHPDRVGGQAHV